MRSLEFDDPGSPLDDALAEDRLCPQVIAAIRAVPILIIGDTALRDVGVRFLDGLAENGSWL